MVWRDMSSSTSKEKGRLIITDLFKCAAFSEIIEKKLYYVETIRTDRLSNCKNNTYKQTKRPNCVT